LDRVTLRFILVAVHFQLESAIIDFPLPVSDSLVVHHCHYFRLIARPRNIGTAVEVALLSSMETEISVSTV